MRLRIGLSAAPTARFVRKSLNGGACKSNYVTFGWETSAVKREARCSELEQRGRSALSQREPEGIIDAAFSGGERRECD